MLKAYKVRLYPDEQQEILLNKHFGSCRFVYNLALEVKQQAWIKLRRNLSAFDLMKQIPDLKKECEWLKEINAQSLQNAVVNVEKAYTAFFKHGAKYPRFKNKNARQSFHIPQQTEVDFNNKILHIPKFKNGIKAVFTRQFSGEVKTVTISKTPTGKYFASILVDNKKEPPSKPKVQEETTIGLDLGLKSFIVTSNNVTIDNPKYLHSTIHRLKILQHRASRKVKGSINRKKANLKVALLFEKITNQRTDFLQKLSTTIIRENQTICVEDLSVKSMIGNHLLSRSIIDASWSRFVSMLEYKADWYGKNLIKIGRFEASSKICSNCGATNHSLTLADREWKCTNCNTLHNRDLNAAINIKAFALRDSGGGTPGEPVEMSALAESKKQELKVKIN